MKKLLLSKCRGVSPIIATILLIALVIVGAAVTFIVLSGIFTQTTPVDLEIESISDFRSENGDVPVDRFTISIKNIRTEPAVIQTDEIKVFRGTGALLAGWQVLSDLDEHTISGEETVNLDLHCIDTTDELVPQVDRIQVRFNASNSNDPDGTLTSFKSPTVQIGQTYGPVALSVSSTNIVGSGASSDTNLDLTFVNNGTTDLDLFVEVRGETQFFFNGSDSYMTQASITLEKATVIPIDSGPAVTLGWYVNATAGLASGTYYVSILVTDSSLQTMAFTLVPFVI
ncbi:MAG: archaellin/type IV pilin N-terminal domain-containing protein [Candidatus Hodarchaeales archaeon]|jgi:flagellin-like protein